MARREAGFLLGGQWLAEGKLEELYSPYQKQPVAHVWIAGREHLERAIVAARSTFEQTKTIPAFERRRVLAEVAAALASRREELSRIMALEAGKPIKAARAEVDRAALTFRVAAEESTRIGGEYLPLDIQTPGKGKWALVKRFSIGPGAAITPLKFPSHPVADKVAPTPPARRHRG